MQSKIGVRIVHGHVLYTGKYGIYHVTRGCSLFIMQLDDHIQRLENKIKLLEQEKASETCVNVLAQLVEHHTGITEVMGSNPVEARIFFRLLPPDCLNWKIYCDDHSTLSVLLLIYFQSYMWHQPV